LDKSTGVSKRVVIVDYLGRGGIAQASYGYAEALRARGDSVAIVTRAGQELSSGTSGVVGVGRPPGGRAAWHAAVLTRAALHIRRTHPDVVIIQNYLVPVAESVLVGAGHSVGASVFLVVHNHVPHGPRTGLRVGFRRLVQSADAVIAHSSFVADRLPVGDLPVHVLPLPNMLALSSAARRERPRGRRCLQFGILTRANKGSALVRELAPRVDGWDFRLVGVGAGASSPNVSTRDEFVAIDELVDEISAAAVVLLPYTDATQSAAVRITQSLGRVAVASAVGGIPEQVTDGIDGILVPASAGLQQWRDTFVGLTESRLDAIGRAALARSKVEDDAFVSGVAAAIDAG
jgi:glycosyltransferase involved in cell wall biosynthesis